MIWYILEDTPGLGLEVIKKYYLKKYIRIRVPGGNADGILQEITEVEGVTQLLLSGSTLYPTPEVVEFRNTGAERSNGLPWKHQNE